MVKGGGGIKNFNETVRTQECVSVEYKLPDIDRSNVYDDKDDFGANEWLFFIFLFKVHTCLFLKTISKWDLHGRVCPWRSDDTYLIIIIAYDVSNFVSYALTYKRID